MPLRLNELHLVQAPIGHRHGTKSSFSDIGWHGRSTRTEHLEMAVGNMFYLVSVNIPIPTIRCQLSPKEDGQETSHRTWIEDVQVVKKHSLAVA